MEKFRIVKKKSEILELLTTPIEFELKGEVWQTLKENQRLHYHIKSIRDDSINKIIIFESDNRLDFNNQEEVFIRIYHRDLIFKLEPGAYVSAGKKIASPYPETARAVESRGMSRITLPHEIEAQVVLKPLGDSIVTINVQLLDISRGGLGIIISEVNKDFLIRNKTFKLLKINDIDMTGQNEVAVSYTKNLRRGVVKSGLILKTPLVESIFDYICKSIFSK